MNNLYPLKFNPIFLEKIWGGNRIRKELGKNACESLGCGESWEISAIEGQVSVVSNGFLAGNNLEELIEIYMGELVGEKVFDEFGLEFPLLIKFIDAAADLSVQVHPNDEIAKERHGAFGKAEMWYVLDSEDDSMLATGFNQPVSRETYLQKLESKQLGDVLNFEHAEEGDVFYMPAGTVHSIGRGNLLAEIQQTSDITYRIYDFDRRDKNGNARELHTDLALDAIDFEYPREYKKEYQAKSNESNQIVDCKYFKTNILEFNKKIDKDIYELDSFVIYIGIEGVCSLNYNDSEENIKKGDVVLVPASINQYILMPKSSSVKLLEVHL